MAVQPISDAIIRVRDITVQFGKTRVSPCFSATGHWIPKKAKHKDEAWAFFEHYFGGPPAARRAESGWGLHFVSRIADRWAADTDGSGRVWFELTSR